MNTLPSLRLLHHRRWTNQILRSFSSTRYTAPMGDLISRLKIISISSCVMSVVGLPALLVFKQGGDLPNLQQVGLGGLAFLGATTSTVALHFVFGPYVLSMEEPQEDSFLATTRSIWGLQQEHSFQANQIQAYAGGLRPFCNFLANGVPLYVHPELLDDDTRRRLLLATTEMKVPTDREGLALGATATKHEERTKQDKDL